MAKRFPTEAEEALIRYALSMAKSIAFDGCHKIYVHLDVESTLQAQEYGYGTPSGPDDTGFLLPVDQDNIEESYDRLIEAYKSSCGLQFIQSVRHTPEDPNKGYYDLVGQFR